MRHQGFGIPDSFGMKNRGIRLVYMFPDINNTLTFVLNKEKTSFVIVNSRYSELGKVSISPVPQTGASLLKLRMIYLVICTY